MPAERKRPQSQHVIDNAGTLADLEKEAKKTFLELRHRARGWGAA